MATGFQSHGDQWRWVNDRITKELGVDLQRAPKDDRAVSSATMTLFGVLSSLLVDQGVITEAELAAQWNLALAASYEELGVEPTNTVGLRHNKCPNPALANNSTGWSTEGGTGTRTTASGFPRPDVWRSTGTVKIFAPSVAVSPGEVWTYSAWMQRGVLNTSSNITVRCGFARADTSFESESLPVAYALTSTATPYRVWTTVTVPEQVATMYLVFDVPTLTGDYDYTCALAERGEFLMDYFDGDTPGASWDGTAGSSASTWVVA